MAGSVNKHIVLGRLGKDPEVRNSQNGKIVSFSVATSETWKKDGERKERTAWHNIVIFNEALGNVAEKYLKKGHLVYLEGQVETRKWQDQSGQDRWTTETILRPFRGELTLLENANSNGGRSSDDYGETRSRESGEGGSAGSGGRPSGGGRSGGYASDLDDDIPF